MNTLVLIQILGFLSFASQIGFPLINFLYVLFSIFGFLEVLFVLPFLLKLLLYSLLSFLLSFNMHFLSLLKPLLYLENLLV